MLNLDSIPSRSSDKKFVAILSVDSRDPSMLKIDAKLVWTRSGTMTWWERRRVRSRWVSVETRFQAVEGDSLRGKRDWILEGRNLLFRFISARPCAEPFVCRQYGKALLVADQLALRSDVEKIGSVYKMISI